MTQAQRIYFSEAADSSQDLSKLAKQAAHDIRSPLSALNILSRTCLTEMPEEAREMMAVAIERINSIANDLLTAPAAKASADLNLVKEIQQIIDEKKLVHGDIEINFISHSEGGAIACRLSLVDLQRMISNLLNNAIEASAGRKGTITVEVSFYPTFVEVVIIDQGKGIPAKVLSKLGSEGFSFDKTGSGLGLFHAMNTLSAVGGKLSLYSTVRVGTKVKLRIPKEH